MQIMLLSGSPSIHRHTGGLENFGQLACAKKLIHRHTGGLEIYQVAFYCADIIHRHTGGLEICRFQSLRY